MKVGQYRYSNIQYLEKNYSFNDYTTNGSTVVFETNEIISTNSKLFFSLNIPIFNDYELITINIKNDTESKLVLKFTLPKKSGEMDYTIIKFGVVNKIEFNKVEIVFDNQSIATGLGNKLRINKCQDFYNIFDNTEVNITKYKTSIQKLAFEGPQGLIIMINNNTIKLSESGTMELLSYKIFNVESPFLGMAIEDDLVGREKIKITYQY